MLKQKKEVKTIIMETILNFRIASILTVLDLIELGLRSFERVRSAEIIVWDKWVYIDDVMAEKVFRQIKKFPIVKKGEFHFLLSDSLKLENIETF